MKYDMFKMAACGSTAALLLTYGAATSAHSINNEPLGNAGSARDIYSVSCENEEGGDTPTFRLSARVRDKAPVVAPTIRVRITKGTLARAAQDNNGDGNTQFSGYARVEGGNGNYTLWVDKVGTVKTGAEIYDLELHCEGPVSSGYIHTGTLITKTQNQ
ncbi:hypothetical protein [Methylotetracoccus oryzae]|uniref:hypothetical protein n=1 Tax=Methylotetracoccus oryzae TaxID=1919059 RepID=UPI00111AAD3D|nr:hypothetical protein [Methylotetracoccus oryzae]